MLRREDIERREEALSARACRSVLSLGRALSEPADPLRTCFQRDRDRIVHSKAFRRLMHKTQVFLAPEGDHYRTRLTHTLEVAQIARTIARALALNEDLTEAIALGHDLGHTPFGHNGEEVLDEIHPGGFRHNEQSLRVVDILESTPDREGLNLTGEVRDGIVNHSGPVQPSTFEGRVVRLSDRIAYINHDIDDAIRSGVICETDLPGGPVRVFGSTHSGRIANMVMNAVETSDGADDIAMDREHSEALEELRDFMFRNVYHSPHVKRAEELQMISDVIRSLYAYYAEYPEELPDEERRHIERDGVNTAVKDYIAGMTDRFAIQTYKNIFRPGKK